jgi:hypothetical protein
VPLTIAFSQLLQRCLYEFPEVDDKDDAGSPCQMLPPEVVCGLAELLKVDLAAIWKKDRAGPLTERYFELHSKEQLAELAQEWDVFIDPNKPKSSIITILSATSHDRHLPLPKELAPPAKAKAAGPKKGKAKR